MAQHRQLRLLGRECRLRLPRLLLGWACLVSWQSRAHAQQGAASAPPASTLPAGKISQKPAEQAGTPQPSAERAAPVSDDSLSAREVESQTQLAVQHPGVLIDRVVAVVNGEVILESDVDEERRLVAFQPVTDPDGMFKRDKAIERLIDRRLLLQQAALQPHKSTTDAAVASEIATLRQAIPACRAARCETDAGWTYYMAEQGITEAELESYLRDRMEALAFVELRFRSGARISAAEIKTYYEQSMLPEYERRHVKPPSLESLSDRIQAVLLEQRVSGLLSDWLKSLRAQGTVQIVADGTSAT